MASLRRLDQILSSLGYCSRREARAFCRTHEVTVAGARVSQPATKVEAGAVTIDGEPLDHPDGLLVLLHKPAGCVCSHDAGEGPTVYDLLPRRWLERRPRLESIGRLDRDTTGTLLLTDDGQLNHRWTSPHHEIAKVYRVLVEGRLDPALTALFAAGTLHLEGEMRPCRPAQLSILNPHEARLTLSEGRYHQVKRMFAACGHPVLSLHRESFGSYSADGLAPGAWKLLPLPT